MRIHLIHVESGPSSNTWFLPWAHSSRQLYFTTNRPFLPPLKLPFPITDLDLHLIHASVGRHRSSPNGISIGSAVFAQLTADGVECPYFTMGRPFLPIKIAPFHGDLDLHPIHVSLGPPKSSTKTASRTV